MGSAGEVRVGKVRVGEVRVCKEYVGEHVTEEMRF